MNIQKVGVIGGGAWGTALAQTLCRGNLDVHLWAYEPETVRSINAHNVNEVFLPSVCLDSNLKATDKFSDLAGCDLILLVTPVQFTRDIVKNFAPFLEPNVPVVICSKGIETSSGKLLSLVVREILPDAPLAVLSGPSFAIEVAKSLPVALTLACDDNALGMQLVHALAQTHFRLYWSSDVLGAQIGGAVKNVMAIACGICDGKGFGANAHAALITRGFVELVTIGEVLGARHETLTGLSGLGDLILTCSSRKSRNMSLGYELGQGKNLKDILGTRRSVSEGMYTANALQDIASSKGLDLPISLAVFGILNGKVSVDVAIDRLLSRPFKAETEIKAMER